MYEFFTLAQNLPFSVALSVVMIIAILEGIGSLIGLGLSSLLETIIPSVDLEIDGPEIESSTTLSHFISWLRIGKVPFLIVLIVFLTAFGLIGLTTQSVSQAYVGILLPMFVAVPIAIIGSIPVVRVCAGTIAKIFPQDETEAVSETSFIGKIAIITLGEATAGKPTEARLTDEFGQDHYILVEPDAQNITFRHGSEVLITERQGSRYVGILNKHAALSSQ